MDKLPQIHSSHEQERTSYHALENLLPKDLFLLRSEDGGDYGVDKIIEAIRQGSATNIRSHLQVKSKVGARKIGAPLSYPVPIGTLNYLLNSLNSLFLVYVEAEQTFYWEWAGTIAQAFKKQKSRRNKDSQETFSYHFTETLSVKSLSAIHERLVKDASLVKGLNLEANPFNRILVTEYIHNSTYRDYLVMFAAGKYEKIIALAKESTEFSSDLISLVALCYYNTYNYDEALKYILNAEAVAQNPEYKKIRVAIMCEKGIRENNRIILTQAKEVFLSIESNTWGWMDSYNYGNVLSALDELDEAEANYRRALNSEPREAMVWKNLSDIYRKRLDHARELEYLDKALSLNPMLIEALICKGILLGQHLSDYDQALELLEKALEISKSTFLSSRSIYYWIAEFYKNIKNYEQAVQKIEAGLLLYPGDKYLESLKLRTLVVASEFVPKYYAVVVELFEEILLKYPHDTRMRAEQLKILSRKKTASQLRPQIVDAFATQGLRVEPDALVGLEIGEIIFMLENLESLMAFRKVSNFGQLLFERYDVTITKAQKIELKVNFLFSRLHAKINSVQTKDLLPLLQEHANCFIALGEYCTEVLIQLTEADPVEDKATFITEMIMTLPEVLLIEFSRQVGWISQQNGYSSESMDELLEKTNVVKEWFTDCTKPILKGANNILKWTQNEDN